VSRVMSALDYGLFIPILHRHRDRHVCINNCRPDRARSVRRVGMHVSRNGASVSCSLCGPAQCLPDLLDMSHQPGQPSLHVNCVKAGIDKCIFHVVGFTVALTLVRKWQQNTMDRQSGWSRTISRCCGRQACKVPSRVYRCRYDADRFLSMTSTSYCEFTAERIKPRY